MPDPVLDAISLPFEEAIDFFCRKARVPTSHWTEVWRTAHSHSFMVAGAATDALLSDFQDSVKKGVAHGATLEDFRRDFDSIVEKHGWDYNGGRNWRSQIIYDTNLSTAFSAGRYAQLTEPGMTEAFPYWQYVHGDSRRPRPQHLAWNGLTLRADDPFWQTHFPPNGWRCSCRVAPVTAAGLARMGKDGPDTAPPHETRPWRNPKTGAVHQVPIGIDPGFDYNPGLAWKQGGAALPVKAPELRPLRADREDAAWRGAMARFVKAPQADSTIPVGSLPKPLRELIGAQNPDVLLSAESMRKQIAHHPELTLDDYLELPGAIAAPDAVLDAGPRRLILLGKGEYTLVAVLKTTAHGTENYLLSMRKQRKATVRKIARRDTLLQGSLDFLDDE